MERLNSAIAVLAAVSACVAMTPSADPGFAADESAPAAAAVPAITSTPIDGSSDVCTDFRLQLSIFGLLDADLTGLYDPTDEGWVWINRGNPGEPRYQSVSGLATSSKLARNDTPANHDSHDHDVDIEVDPGYEHVLSNVNHPNNQDDFDSLDQLLVPTTIESEWEIGVFPSEKGPSVVERYFPRWAWPSIGDRVWVEGNWIFDCGHGKELCLERDPQYGICVAKRSYYRSEIHPPRAMAAMRNQAHTLSGTGTTPVPVTATDLYIHGHAGFVMDSLECGMATIIGGGTCEISPHPHRPTPIDTKFEFDICVPERPVPGARLRWSVEPGPGNTVPVTLDLEPDIKEAGAPPGCSNSSEPLDLVTAAHVKVELTGSGLSPDEYYARRILVGWVYPPGPPLQHLHVGIDRMDLHNSKDDDSLINPYCSDDGEVTFFYADLNRAPENEWLRLADFAPVDEESGNSRMNDYDGELFGHSHMNFDGASYDFYIRNQQPFTLRAEGIDQDCYDQFFGDGHELDIVFPYVWCNTSPFECFDGNNDEFDQLEATFLSPDYGTDPATGVGTLPVAPPPDHYVFPNPGGDPLEFDIPEYVFDVTIEKVPLALEDTSDLAVTKTCVPASGTSVLCSIRVDNPGPGLPRDVKVEDSLTTSLAPGEFSVGAPEVFHGDGTPVVGASCTQPDALHLSCLVGTVPVGDFVTVRFLITVGRPGDFDDTAVATTSSVDPDAANNQDTDGFTVVAIDVKPQSSTNPINVKDAGVVPVAILTANGFVAASADPASVCFGDAEDPAGRSCVEVHATGHLVDVDHDKDVDLQLHYAIPDTGIDPGDASACLSGRTDAGRTILGCDIARAY